MQQGQASRTAIGAAGHRAAHQLLEHGFIFTDPHALAILGQDADEAIALAKEKPERRPLRLFIAMRSRFAEDSAHRAINEGARQIVVLGAGLDTFAYRVQGPEDLKVFELDHTPTQRDKRSRLADARLAEPTHVAYVAHDFEGGGLIEALKAAGLKSSARTFALWLGVTPYLTRDAVFATLAELAELPSGTEIVFDYANPPHMIEEAAAQNFRRAMAESVAANGEPFRCYFESGDLHAGARRLGFTEIEDLDREALVSRYLPNLSIAPRSGPGGHVVRMAKQ